MIKPKANIYQIYYRDEQKRFLDKLFKPCDNSLYCDESLEFAVFQRLFNRQFYLHSEYFGALSWRFTEKTGLNGQDLMDTLLSFPDVDLFYINPFPHNEAIHQSLWMQGEAAETGHHGFLEVAQAFFEAAGLPLSELYRLIPSSAFSVCNYFVARPVFWRSYIPFVINCLNMAESSMPPDIRKILHSSAGDMKGIHKGATYVPFIIERLLTVFLMSPEAHSLHVHQITLPAKEATLNDDLRELREMKDVAVLTRSDRILDMWREKREAYCRIYYSKEWCDRHIMFLNNAPVVW